MATARDIALDSDAKRLRINELEVHDEEVVEFLEGIDESDRSEVLGRAVQIGVTAMRLMDTSQEVEYVERRLSDLEEDLEAEVEELRGELDEKFGDDGHVETVLEKHFGEEGRVRTLLERHLGTDGHLQQRIDEAFGEDGAFRRRLDEELGEDGEKIEAALDPDREGTPTHRLKRTFLDELSQLRKDLGFEEGEQEVRDRTHLGGEDFEDTVEDILGDVVRQTNNELEYTGDTEGELEGRDVGDFVVTLGDTGQRIVVEAKTEYKPKNDIQEEMEDAIRNRDADFGVFVAKHLGKIPETKLGWFNEFPDGEFVTVVLAEDDDAEIEPGYLRMAFNWARMRAIQAHAEIGDAFDPEQLQAEISEIEDSIGRFSQIRGQCTEIEKAKNSILEELETIETDVKSRLGNITAELQKASAEG